MTKVKRTINWPLRRPHNIPCALTGGSIQLSKREDAAITHKSSPSNESIYIKIWEEYAFTFQRNIATLLLNVICNQFIMQECICFLLMVVSWKNVNHVMAWLSIDMDATICYARPSRSIWSVMEVDSMRECINMFLAHAITCHIFHIVKCQKYRCHKVSSLTCAHKANLIFEI